MSDAAQVLDPSQQVGGLSLSVLDLWRWGFSDFSRSMELQAVVGQFFVATALGAHEQPRQAAGDTHLSYEGFSVATLASRSWRDGRRPGVDGPMFSAPAPRRWDVERGETVAVSRTADCYVFCLLITDTPEPTTACVLDAFEWRFWVVSTAVIDRDLGEESRVGGAWLDDRADAVDHIDLRAAIDETLTTG